MGFMLKFFKSFKNDTQGGFAIFFAIALLALLIFIGAALDFSRLHSAQQKGQNRLDATVLATAVYLRELDNVTPSNDTNKTIADKKARELIKSYTGLDGFKLSIDKVSVADNILTITAQGTGKPAIANIFGIKTLDFKVSSAANLAGTKSFDVDVVLVVDITGSMMPTLGAIQDNMKKFSQDISNALKAIGTDAGEIRLQVIFFRDYTDSEAEPWWLDWTDPKMKASSLEGYASEGPMFISPFYKFPDDRVNLDRYINSFAAWGGGDIAEAGLEAVYYALKTDWKDADTTIRTTVLWTDAPARPLHNVGMPFITNFSKVLFDKYYPKNIMPKTIDAFKNDYLKFHRENANNQNNVTSLVINVITSENMSAGALYPTWNSMDSWDGVQLNYGISSTSTQIYNKMIKQITDSIISQMDAKDLTLTR